MLVKRLLKLTKAYSLFLFGARGVGKSTLVETDFNPKNSLYINLLDREEEDRFSRAPNTLIHIVEAMPKSQKYVIIDEIQKIPKLLDIVHLLIETKKCNKFFILTGSSARKLKAGGANLLAGRAFVYHLFPFSYLELADKFELQTVLEYGLLPGISQFDSNDAKRKFLQAYTLTYLKEEVWGEQLVKNLDPFRRFIEVAAQCNGKVINYSSIARDVGTDDKTVKNYFSILEDTLLAFILEPFRHSFRKRLKTAPKFYFFDVGVARALAHMLSVKPKARTSYYDELFESFIIMECIKLSSYFQNEFKFSYLMTGSDVEIDLVVERPGKPLLLIEIKSSDDVKTEQLQAIEGVAKDIGENEAVCFSNDKRRKKIGNVTVYPWQEGVKKLFGRG